MPNTSATGGWLQPTGLVPAQAEDAALDDLLQAAVVGITGLASDMVRPRWQRVPPQQPADPDATWCAIGVVKETPDAHASLIHHSDGDHTDADTGPLSGGWDESQRHIDIRVVATFYGAAARAYAGILRDGLEIAQNRDMLRANGLAFVSAGDPVITSDLISNQWRARVDQPIELRRQVTRSYAVRNINEASGEIVSDSTPDPVNNPAREPWQAP